MNEYCLICMKKIKRNGVYSLFFNTNICHPCFIKMNRKPYKRKIDNISATSYFPYEDEITSLIYTFKGCNDIALAPCFLSYDCFYLKMRYKGYYVVPIPSFIDRDLQRGFNHVEEIFRCLNLPYLKILKKTEDFKQSSLKKKDRELAVLNIIRTSDELLTEKKILIVDDILTTGSTIRRAIKLIKELKPKCIKVVTIAYKVNEIGRNNGTEISKKG